MKSLTLCCCCAALLSFVSSCAPQRPELPEDQAAKMRQHRIAPSEDREETYRTKLGEPLPSAADSSWKF